MLMNDYEVRFEFELVDVVTYVDATSEAEARELAEQQIARETGFDMSRCHGVVMEKSNQSWEASE